MKHKIAKKVLSAALAVTMLFGSGMAANTSLTKADLFKVSASAEEYLNSQFKYDVTDGEVTIKEYRLKTSSTVTIPAKIGGHNVVAIGYYAFGGCDKLTTVNFEDGSKLETIGPSAFSGREKLETITIPKSVKIIDNYAFNNCGLLTVNFERESQLEKIEEGAFRECKGLKTVDFTNVSKLDTIEKDTFFYCEELETITIPKSVTKIGSGAFWLCKALAEITIPSGVTKIESGTFHGCENLQTVTIPRSVTSIGESAFAFCGKHENGYTSEYKIDTVNYTGSEDEWNLLNNNISYGNEPLLDTPNFHYNYVDPDPDPEVTPTISANDLTLNYKESKKLDVTTENADGYTVVYSSKNEKIAKVSDDGKVTALKRGTTEITATIVDSNGDEVASDTCKVTVNYTPLQWFIKIVLFGWIWY